MAKEVHQSARTYEIHWSFHDPELQKAVTWEMSKAAYWRLHYDDTWEIMLSKDRRIGQKAVHVLIQQPMHGTDSLIIRMPESELRGGSGSNLLHWITLPQTAWFPCPQLWAFLVWKSWFLREECFHQGKKQIELESEEKTGKRRERRCSTVWVTSPDYHREIAAAAAKSLQLCLTLCNPIDGSPPGSCPSDSPDKNIGVGCHFLLQCMKVKSENEVVQSCPTLSDPMDYSLPGSSVHGIFQARVLEWVATDFSTQGNDIAAN